jgi:RNA polymerase sigma factor (sigma-70 family)
VNTHTTNSKHHPPNKNPIPNNSQDAQQRRIKNSYLSFFLTYKRKRSMKDDQLITLIRKGERERPLKVLYKEFPKIKSSILGSGGDEVIAKQLFHDSLILLIEKVTVPSFELSSKLSTYLFGINRFLWKNELRKRKKHQELEWNEAVHLTDEDLGFDDEKEAQLKQMEGILANLSTRCQSIFELFYFKSESMKAIADKLGFSSVNSAKTQKYKCLEKAIELANQTQQSNS